MSVFLLATLWLITLTFSPARAATISLTTLIYDAAGTTLLHGPTTSRSVVTVPVDISPNTVYTVVVALDTSQSGKMFKDGYQLSLEIDTDLTGGGDAELSYVAGSAQQLALRKQGNNYVSEGFSVDPDASFGDGTPRTGMAAMGSANKQYKARDSDKGIFSMQVLVGPQGNITPDDLDIAGAFGLKVTPEGFGQGMVFTDGDTLSSGSTGLQVVPEPGTFRLLGIGLSGFARVSRGSFRG